MKFLTSLFLTAVLTMTTGGYVNGQVPGQQDQPQIPNELRLERENMLLTARIAELEAQITQLKTVLVQDRISKAAPTLIQKLQEAAPEWDVNPQTLEFTRKQTGVVQAPPGTASVVQAPVPAQPRP